MHDGDADELPYIDSLFKVASKKRPPNTKKGKKTAKKTKKTFDKTQKKKKENQN